MSNEVVPFGKYKGQPLEVLQNDRPYLDWLSSQDWFREKFANLYQTIIINNFAEPDETPEHNKLQAKFLDADFCVSLKKLLPEAYDRPAKFESGGWDAVFSGYAFEIKPSVGDDYPAILRTIRTRHNGYYTEFAGKDAGKPCHIDKAKVLLFEHFSSSAVTEAEFRAIFKASGIMTIRFDEI